MALLLPLASDRSQANFTSILDLTGVDTLPQTLGETRFDFVTFSSSAMRAYIGTRCSIVHFGLILWKNNVLLTQKARC
jgi:hypothetical protein